MLQSFGLFLLLAATLAAGIGLGWTISPTPQGEPRSGSFHSGLTIERFADLSELLVVKLEVSDVLVSDLHGRTGGAQIVVIVKGEVSLGVDLSLARFEQINTAGRTATLTLPPPGPSGPRLDHGKTKVVLIQKEGLWSLSPGTGPYLALFDRSMNDAQQLVSAAGNGREADERARHHAEAVLQLFFRSLDWSVHIGWSDRNDDSPSPTP